MNQPNRRIAGRLSINIVIGVLLVVALIQDRHLWFLILNPVSIGLACLLFLGLHHRLRDASRALLLAAIAAAVWPWTAFLCASRLGDVGVGLLMGFLAPYVIIAVAAMMST
jgi:hypothetical protein